MNLPFFSVIIPCYNREKFIEKAIVSVLNQDFQDFEIIVIDDASTDQSVQIIEGLSDDRIHLIKLKTNSERSHARNLGLKAAVGKYICFLDSDDRFLVEHLSNFKGGISKSKLEHAIWFTSCVHEKNEIILPTKSKSPKGMDPFEYILRSTFNPTRTCISNKMAKEIEFDSNVDGIEDLDFCLRLAINYPLYFIDRPSCVYVLHDESYTLADANRFNKELKRFEIIFDKPELSNLLPEKTKKFLFSKCHYHLAISSFQSNQATKTRKSIWKAFRNYPKGYNSKANKTMAVMYFYSLPFLGRLLQSFRHKTKLVFK
jgi:glycosyltransferase involved in cell wall biosynthesis